MTLFFLIFLVDKINVRFILIHPNNLSQDPSTKLQNEKKIKGKTKSKDAAHNYMIQSLSSSNTLQHSVT